jgi:hypothetical protein
MTGPDFQLGMNSYALKNRQRDFAIKIENSSQSLELLKSMISFQSAMKDRSLLIAYFAE